MPASISDREIMAGVLKCGGYRLATMRADSGEPSSSTIAMAALCRLSGMAVDAT